MSFKNQMRIDGDLLRRLREAQGLDLALLSQQVSLSMAQLKELESAEIAQGERSLFYSDAIRKTAARKVALQLGADPDMLASSSDQGLANDVSPMQILDDLAQLLEKQKQSRKIHQRRMASTSTVLWLGALLCLAGASVWYLQKPLWQQASGHISDTEPVARSVVTAMEPDQAAAPVMPIDAHAIAPTSQRVNPDALCAQNRAGATLKASSPIKAGNMVYVVAQADTAVCVRDATGKITAVGLKAQESRSFYGVAPWTIHFDQTSNVQLFYQGQRLRWPEGNQATFTLSEVQGTY